MADLINKTDTLNQGREKLNKAIDDAETAKWESGRALSKAESTQTQLDAIVIEGDSSVEAAQARVDENNETHSTLKARIDDGFAKVAEQYADKTYVDDKLAGKATIVVSEEEPDQYDLWFEVLS